MHYSINTDFWATKPPLLATSGDQNTLSAKGFGSVAARLSFVVLCAKRDLNQIRWFGAEVGAKNRFLGYRGARIVFEIAFAPISGFLNESSSWLEMHRSTVLSREK